MSHTEMCYKTCFQSCLSIQIANLIIRNITFCITNHRFDQYEASLNFILFKNLGSTIQQTNETKGIKNTNQYKDTNKLVTFIPAMEYKTQQFHKNA